MLKTSTTIFWLGRDYGIEAKIVTGRGIEKAYVGPSAILDTFDDPIFPSLMNLFLYPDFLRLAKTEEIAK